MPSAYAMAQRADRAKFQQADLGNTSSFKGALLFFDHGFRPFLDVRKSDRGAPKDLRGPRENSALQACPKIFGGHHQRAWRQTAVPDGVLAMLSHRRQSGRGSTVGR